MLRKNQGANFLFIVIRKGAHKASHVVFGMDTESQVEKNRIYSSSKGVLPRTLLFPSSLSFIAILEESPPVGKINSSSIKREGMSNMLDIGEEKACHFHHFISYSTLPLLTES